MRRRHFLAPSLVCLPLLLVASAGTASTPPAIGGPPIEHIVAERVKLAFPEDQQARLAVVDDARIGLFGATSGLPVDALRQTRSVRDLDVLVKLKFVRFIPRTPFKLGGAAAVVANIAAATISSNLDLLNTSQQPFYYPPSLADNAPIDVGEDRETSAQLARLLSADGCGARTIALLRRIAAGPGQGKLTAAAIDARYLLKRFGSGAYHPTDGCSAPEFEPDYVSTIATAS